VTLNVKGRAWAKAEVIPENRRLVAMKQLAAVGIADVISADFGSRSRHESLMAEVLTVCASIRDALHRLPRWMRSRRVSVNDGQSPGFGVRAALRWVDCGLSRCPAAFGC
jgi:hypothetical protein